MSNNNELLSLLVSKLRKCQTFDDLIEIHTLIGPSDEELTASYERLKLISEERKYCEWDERSPTSKVERIRVHWEKLLCEQAQFERKYGL